MGDITALQQRRRCCKADRGCMCWLVAALAMSVCVAVVVFPVIVGWIQAAYVEPEGVCGLSEVHIADDFATANVTALYAGKNYTVPFYESDPSRLKNDIFTGHSVFLCVFLSHAFPPAVARLGDARAEQRAYTAAVVCILAVPFVVLAAVALVLWCRRRPSAPGAYA